MLFRSSFSSSSDRNYAKPYPKNSFKDSPISSGAVLGPLWSK
jgi:hypothetical protein